MANYNLHKVTDGYRKKKPKDVMDTICKYVLGSGSMGNFTYTIQKRYLRKFKFKAGQSMKIKDYWRQLKEINDFLPYFLPDKYIGSPRITPSAFDDNNLKDILDGNLQQVFKAICKRNQYLFI